MTLSPTEFLQKGIDGEFSIRSAPFSRVWIYRPSQQESFFGISRIEEHSHEGGPIETLRGFLRNGVSPWGRYLLFSLPTWREVGGLPTACMHMAYLIIPFADWSLIDASIVFVEATQSHDLRVVMGIPECSFEMDLSKVYLGDDRLVRCAFEASPQKADEIYYHTYFSRQEVSTVDHKVIVKLPYREGYSTCSISISGADEHTAVTLTDDKKVVVSTTSASIQLVLTFSGEGETLIPASIDQVINDKSLLRFLNAKQSWKCFAQSLFYCFPDFQKTPVAFTGIERYPPPFSRDYLFTAMVSSNEWSDDYYFQHFLPILWHIFSVKDCLAEPVRPTKEGTPIHEPHTHYQYLLDIEPELGELHDGDTLGDYQMVDTAPMLVAVLGSLIANYPLRRPIFKKLLASKRGSVSLSTRLIATIELVINEATKYAESQEVVDLPKFEGFVGDWRDSQYGYETKDVAGHLAIAQRPYGVWALYCSALEQLPVLLSPESLADVWGESLTPDQHDNLRKLVGISQELLPRYRLGWKHFKVGFSSQELDASLDLFYEKYLQKFLIQPLLKTNKESPYFYLSLGLLESGHHLAVAHLDVLFRLFLGAPEEQELELIVNTLDLLKTEYGYPITNGGCSLLQHDIHSPNKYHGTVYWLMMSGLVPFALQRALSAGNGSAATEARLKEHLDFSQQTLRKLCDSMVGVAEYYKGVSIDPLIPTFVGVNPSFTPGHDPFAPASVMQLWNLAYISASFVARAD